MNGDTLFETEYEDYRVAKQHLANDISLFVDDYQDWNVEAVAAVLCQVSVFRNVDNATVGRWEVEDAEYYLELHDPGVEVTESFTQMLGMAA